MPSHYDKPMNPNAQGLGSVAGETVDSFTTGPRTPGVGAVSTEEINEMMSLPRDRANELEQRGYQTYITELERLRKAENPTTAPAATAQNQYNEIRANRNARRAHPGINLEDYFAQPTGYNPPAQSNRARGLGSFIGQPVGSAAPAATATPVPSAGLLSGASPIESAVRSGQMSPAEAATAATGVSPFSQMPRAGGALGGLGGRRGPPQAIPTDDPRMDAYQKGVEDSMPLATFLKSLQTKGM